MSNLYVNILMSCKFKFVQAKTPTPPPESQLGHWKGLDLSYTQEFENQSKNIKSAFLKSQGYNMSNYCRSIVI